MFICPAVNISTRNLLPSSSTHQPSDSPFRVVSVSFGRPAQRAFHSRRTGIVLSRLVWSGGATALAPSGSSLPRRRQPSVRNPRPARQDRAAQGSLNLAQYPSCLPPSSGFLASPQLRSFDCRCSDPRHAAPSEACWRLAIIGLPRLPAACRWRAGEPPSSGSLPPLHCCSLRIPPHSL